MAKVKGKKKWVSILAPSDLGNIEIGECPVTDAGQLVGRSIVANLATLGDVKKQNTKIKFVVKEIKEGKGITEAESLMLVSSYVKRAARRSKSKIEESFLVKLKDNDAKVKPLIVTANKVKGSIEKEIRRETKKFLTNYCSKKTFNEVIDALTKYALQKDLKTHLKKIYPIYICEIRVFERVNKKAISHIKDEKIENTQ